MMQEAIPYKTWLPIAPQNPIGRSSPTKSSAKSTINGGITKGYVKNMVEENAVIVFGKRGCCMSHVVKRLLQGLGVNPAVFEVDEEDEVAVVEELQEIMASAAAGKDEGLQFPAVFIGGRLFGGLERLMATHITGELIPILKEAGALWL